MNQRGLKNITKVFGRGPHWVMLVVAIFVGTASTAHAAGTLAGTLINNRATVRYTQGSNTFTQNSNTNTIAVDALVNNTMTWQDALPGVIVSSGQTNRVLTMRLTNTGNAIDSYTLTGNSVLGGDDFDPVLVSLYLDTNGNNVYDPGTDTLYVPGTNDPSLGPDQSRSIFVLCTIPSSGISDGNLGRAVLAAASRTGTGAPGTTFPGMGPGGTDAIIGLSGGASSATGAYVVSGAVVNIAKTVAVLDQYGGNQPLTGATLRYTLSVTAAGTGTAVGVVINDPIPFMTTYTPGTLRLNSVALSDTVDADAGDVGGTTVGAVTVRLGNLTNASPVQTITFEVTIN